MKTSPNGGGGTKTATQWFSVIIIIIIIISKRMFMVLSSWQETSRVHPVYMMNMERRQAAADPQTRPNNPGCESACRLPAGCL